MDIIDELRKIVIASINQLARDENKSDFVVSDTVVVETPKANINCDYSTNAAMIVAKDFSSNPREIGEQLKNRLMENHLIDSVSVEGPGFLNFVLKKSVWGNLLWVSIIACFGC